jgi:hypothetical protein
MISDSPTNPRNRRLERAETLFVFDQHTKSNIENAGNLVQSTENNPQLEFMRLLGQTAPSDDIAVQIDQWVQNNRSRLQTKPK